MNKGKIVIAGGTGFIGQEFKQRFLQEGYEVVIISRNSPSILWSDRAGIIAALENAAMLINMAGKSVNCRYHQKNKDAIFSSRVETTRILGEAILQCKNPPSLWINSSTATIYRHAEDRPMTESRGEIGTGFSVEVAKLWEKTFFSFTFPHTRQVALRTAIVLGKSGGAFRPLKNLVRYGLGGKQGNGKQMFSWIHIEDLFRAILFIQEHSDMEGVYNCSSPEPLNNTEMMKVLRHEMKMPFGFPAPSWLLKIGAVLIKTETELVLKSRWVLPERLLQKGFVFKYSDLKAAIKNILK